MLISTICRKVFSLDYHSIIQHRLATCQTNHRNRWTLYFATSKCTIAAIGHLFNFKWHPNHNYQHPETNPKHGELQPGVRSKNKQQDTSYPLVQHELDHFLMHYTGMVRYPSKFLWKLLYHRSCPPQHRLQKYADPLQHRKFRHPVCEQPELVGFRILIGWQQLVAKVGLVKHALEAFLGSWRLCLIFLSRVAVVMFSISFTNLHRWRM